MTDGGDLRRLGWSVACYYIALVVLGMLIAIPSGGLGHALLVALGNPFLMIALFFGGLSVDNAWIGRPVVVGVLVGLCAAMVLLRGTWRIAAVLGLLTIAMIYGFRIATIVGA
ncbi:MAG TPA: hypothetical protein VGF43_22595 [Dongiaceae bacterium]